LAAERAPIARATVRPRVTPKLGLVIGEVGSDRLEPETMKIRFAWNSRVNLRPVTSLAEMLGVGRVIR
jgi:hypothetical protein